MKPLSKDDVLYARYLEKQQKESPAVNEKEIDIMNDYFGNPNNMMNTPMPNDPFASNDPFAQTDTFGSDPFGPPMANNPYMQPQNPFGASMNGQFGNMTPPQEQKTKEEEIFDFALSTSKNFIKALTTCTIVYWNKAFFDVMIGGAIVFGIGIVGFLCGLSGLGLTFVLAGILSAAIGIFVFGLTYEKAKAYGREYVFKGQKEASREPIRPIIPSGPRKIEPECDDFFITDEDENIEEDTVSYFSDNTNSNDDDFEEITEEDTDDFDDFDFEEDYEDNSNLQTPEQALNSMPNVDSSLVSRQLLFDKFISLMPSYYSKFSELTTLDAESDEFLYLEGLLRTSALNNGFENIPEINSIKKNFLLYNIEIEKVKGFNAEKVAEDMFFDYMDDKYQVTPDTASVKVVTMGTKVRITMFTGTDKIVSLKDMMLSQKEFFLETKNIIPCAIGVNNEGTTVVKDLAKLESIIISGMPRSGKTWFVLTLMYQMAIFNAPSELQFYICDVKDDVSDYRYFVTPHVKRFAGNSQSILETLRYLVTVEAPRRKKIFGEADVLNIWDYRKENPNNKMPVIYVVIDEILSMVGNFDKNEMREYNNYIRELISQLPALGIRMIFVPHVIKNDIIEKKSSDLVTFRVSVCGNAEHIENATDAKPKDFPFVLANKGEMAARIDGKVMYIKAPLITDDNISNKRLYEFMYDLWQKIEPDSVTDCYRNMKANKVATAQALQKASIKTNKVKEMPKAQPKPMVSEEDEFLQSMFDSTPVEMEDIAYTDSLLDDLEDDVDLNLFD